MLGTLWKRQVGEVFLTSFGAQEKRKTFSVINNSGFFVLGRTFNRGSGLSFTATIKTKVYIASIRFCSELIFHEKSISARVFTVKAFRFPNWHLGSNKENFQNFQLNVKWVDMVTQLRFYCWPASSNRKANKLISEIPQKPLDSRESSQWAFNNSSRQFSCLALDLYMADCNRFNPTKLIQFCSFLFIKLRVKLCSKIKVQNRT